MDLAMPMGFYRVLDGIGDANGVLQGAKAQLKIVSGMLRFMGRLGMRE